MSNPQRVWSVIVVSVCALRLCATPAQAAEVVFEQQEVLGFDWARHLLTYEVEFKRGQARADNLSLLDAEGAETPFQVSAVEAHRDGSIRRAKISFYGELPANGSMRYVLRTGAGKASAPTRPVTASAKPGQALELANSATAVRLLPAGKVTPAAPLPLAEVPGPVQGFRLAGGHWVGGSRFLAEDAPETTAVRGYETRVLAAGPLFAEASVRYELADGGHYEVRVRLEAEAPMVFLWEEADTGLVQEPALFVEYLLASDQEKGWLPDILYKRAGRKMPDSDAALAATLKEADIEIPESRVGPQWVGTLEATEEPAALFGINAASRWSPAPLYAALLRRADLKAKDRPFVSITPLHLGQWRNTQWAEGLEHQIVQYPARQIALRVPLTAPRFPGSYIHTGEYDTKLPATMVRRVWGLMVGPAPSSMQALWDARLHYGYVSLDDVKDWILDWPADPKVTYPRQFVTAQDVTRARKTADTNPFKDELLKLPYYLEDAKKIEALARKAASTRGVAKHKLFRGGYMGLPWIQGFHQANYAGWTREADAALSLGIDPALRQRLRAVLAAMAHAASEPDVNRRGCGVHQGNPNMPIRRFLVLPHIAAVIPDHPRAREWLEVSAQFVRWKLQTMVGPKGDWGEPGLYYNASFPYFLQAAIILQRAGYLSDAEARQCGAVAHSICGFLTPPDPRFENTRVIPGIGHGAHMRYCYAFANAVMLREVDLGKAKDMVWAWHAMGRPKGREGYDLYPLFRSMHGDLVAGLKPEALPPALMTSRWHPGWGAVMRAHAGDPNETYLAYRQGYMVSHVDANQGDFVLYAKGAPLTPTPYAHYILHGEKRGDWGGPNGLCATKSAIFCRVRFGAADRFGGQPGGGPESNVNEWHAGQSVDYVRGWGDYDDTNRWLTPRDDRMPADPAGPIHWDRQIMFLKGQAAAGPNYFVFRDTFTGHTEQNKYWHLRTCVPPESIQRGERGFEVRTPQGTALDVTFLSPAGVKADIVSGRDSDKVCTVAQVPVGPEQNEYTVLLYPRRADEKVPAYRMLASGVVEVETTEGTDYVFLGGENTLRFEDEELSFVGRSGAVRVRAGEVHFVLATADGDGVVSYRGLAHSGPAPFEAVVPTGKLSEKTVRIRGPKYQIKWDSRRLKPEGEDLVFDSAAGGGVEVLKGGGARLVLGPGRGKLGYKGFTVWGEGPFDFTVDETGLHGVTEGRERMIYMTYPPIPRGMPALWVDGVGCAPGYGGGAMRINPAEDTLAVPVLTGRHEIAIRAAEQPDLFE